MSRLCGGSRTGTMASMSHESLPVPEKAVPCGVSRRSALGDISALVSNVSSSTGSLGSKLASATTSRTQITQVSGAGGKPGGGLFTTTSSGTSVPMEEDPACAAVMDVDKDDIDDPQCIAEYAGDIFRYLQQEETLRLPRPDYMERQADLNEKMRGILVDWLVEVHLKYKLKPETLYLAVNLIDRFLEKRQVSRKKLQLVGVCGMLIAAKYEEIYPPQTRDFVYITDKAYTRDEILQMEITMLNVLEFQITVPSPVTFLDRFAKVNKCDEAHLCLARYVMELTICDVKMLQYCPSHLAAAALFLSNKLVRRHPSWPSQLIKHTRYTESLIKNCAKEMCCLVEGADRSSLAAVRKKYAHQRFHGVSKMAASV